MLTYQRELCVVVCNTAQSLAVVFSGGWITVTSLWKRREMRNAVCEPESSRLIEQNHSCNHTQYIHQKS